MINYSLLLLGTTPLIDVFFRNTGCNIVLSSRSIGDFATQFLANNGIYATGRVSMKKLKQVSSVCDVPIIDSVSVLRQRATGADNNTRGNCVFEDVTVANSTFVCITSRKSTTNESGDLITSRSLCTILLTAPSKQLLDEVERSFNDVLCVLSKLLKATNQRANAEQKKTTMMDESLSTEIGVTGGLVGGGGSVEAHLATVLKRKALEFDNKKQTVFECVADALLDIPRALCSNNISTTQHELMTQLQDKHKQQQQLTRRDQKQEAPDKIEAFSFWGIDMRGVEGEVRDMWEVGVIEPSSIKRHSIRSAFNAASIILSVHSCFH